MDIVYRGKTSEEHSGLALGPLAREIAPVQETDDFDDLALHERIRDLAGQITTRPQLLEVMGRIPSYLVPTVRRILLPLLSPHLTDDIDRPQPAAGPTPAPRDVTKI